MINRYQRGSGALFAGVDWWTVGLYLAICIAGCLCITSSSFDELSTNHFAFSHFYIKQAIWLVAAVIIATFILLIDVGNYHKFAYIAYAFGIALLLAALLFGREVNGAKAWLEFGAFRLQPAEIAKIATALAMARLMSDYSFSVGKLNDLMKVALLLLLPLAIIILQNDTGSGIVLCSFILVLYREGLNKWLCIPIILLATLFIISFIFTPLVLLIGSVLICTLCNMMIVGEVKSHVIYLSSIFGVSLLILIFAQLFGIEGFNYFKALLWATLLSLPVVVVYAFRKSLLNTFILIAMFLGSTIFLPTTDYIFNSILREHQQNRILSFLGIISDPLGVDYNVNQSKIAIGSGGWFGKGFLSGTQIRYGFVPERHTDFIFCSLGEEWGFVGCIIVLTLFCALIIRLMMMGERQHETFGRIYCYCVASIFLFHILVNVGMTIGLMPVMGIPLPFMSYGGSSLVAFTILLFIAIKLDSTSRANDELTF